MRKKEEVTAAVLDCLSLLAPSHCGLQHTASDTGASCEVKSSPTLCHRSINDIPSKQSGSFFPCLHSKRVMQRAESEIEDIQAALSSTAPHEKRVKKIKLRKEGISTTIYPMISQKYKVDNSIKRKIKYCYPPLFPSKTRLGVILST